jgi:hypothetical protein
MADQVKTPTQRYDYGASLRERAPLDSHVEWNSPGRGRDPVQLIEEQNHNRLECTTQLWRATNST